MQAKEETMKREILAMSVIVSLAAAAQPSFVVPDRIYASVGHECNVYFANVFDSATPWAYAYEALCERGRHERHRWCWTPKKEDAGTSKQLVLRAIDDSGLVAAVTTTVTVAELADKTKPVSMAILSASLVNCGYPRKIFEDMRQNGFAMFKSVGTRDARKAAAGGKPLPVEGSRDDIPFHDGYGGWTFNSFLTRYEMSDDEISKVQSEAERQQLLSMGVRLAPEQAWRLPMSKSPFIRIENGKKVLDVQMWLDKVNGGRPPEVIVITLGINGTFGPRDEHELAKMVDEFQVPNAKELLALLRGACPNSVIGLGTPYVGCSQDGFAENYGCLQSSVQFRHNVFYLARALMRFAAESGDARLFVMPVGMVIDPMESYPKREVPAHARSMRKVWRDVNALHPSEDGGWQVADAIVSFILGHWSEL